MERTLDIQAGERNEINRQLENARRTIAMLQGGGTAVDVEVAEPVGNSRHGSRPDTAGTHLTSAPNSSQVTHVLTYYIPSCARGF
jgi:hypothetical protein